MSDETKFSLIDLPDVPDSVDNALKNLTDVPTKNAGQTFGDIWYLVFGGISHAADKKRMKYAEDLNRYHDELTTKIESIPLDRKIEPSIQITAQALENSKYCVTSDELRRMFVNLIGNTMDKKYEKNTHPSFPEILKQMSPLDARVISEFKNSPNKPIVNYSIELANGDTQPHMQYVYLGNTGNSLVEFASSISSLQRLGLLSIRFDEWYSNDTIYNAFKKTSAFSALEQYIRASMSNAKPHIEKGLCKITPLGKDFLKVCLS